MFPAWWDVSSLVLWDKKPIIKEYNLGKISRLIHGDFVGNIVNKIKKINMQKI